MWISNRNNRNFIILKMYITLKNGNNLSNIFLGGTIWKENRKWISIAGFIISIILLTVAIILSANEEKVTREAKINKNQSLTQASNITQASSDFGRTVNELKNNTLKEQNTINVSKTVNEINEIIENTIDETNNLQSQGNVMGEAQAVANQNESQDENQNENSNNEEQNNEGLNQDESSNLINDSKSNEKFIKPVDGEYITNYSMDSLIYSNTLQEWVTHRGVDIKADKTTVVKASADGTIKSIKEDPRYGLSITIEHSDGFQSVYSSLLSAEFVKEGDIVTQGQSIGTVGNSAVFESAEGSHLHFELLKDGEYVNPDIYIK